MTAPFPISILDQSPIIGNATPAEAIASTIALAKLAAAKETFVIIDRDLLRQTEQSFEASRSNFAAGGSGALSVLDALRMLLDARLQHENARAHWASASADVERAVGIDLDALAAGGTP